MENRFDELAKALVGGVSRREVLRGLGVWVAGGTLAALGLTRKAEAQLGTATRKGECHGLCRSSCPNSNAARECAQACRNCVGRGNTFSLDACFANGGITSGCL